MQSGLKTFLDSAEIPYSINIELSSKTWIKRGGMAEYWIQPININQIQSLIIWCQQNHYHYDLIGSSSNCYFLNSYKSTLVISTLKLNKKQLEDDYLICECGYKMSLLSKFCIDNGFLGYEGFIDLPGTVGGAIVNNSGCYGSLIQDVLHSVDLLQNGVVKTYGIEELKFSHRDSALKRKELRGVILLARFKIDKTENIDILKERSKKIKIERKQKKEFEFPSLGTTLSDFEIKDDFYFYKTVSFFLHKIGVNYLDVIRISTKIYLYLNKTKKFRDYISPLGLSTFLWKDENADAAFVEYKKFIERKAKKYKFEIQIEGRI